MSHKQAVFTFLEMKYKEIQEEFTKHEIEVKFGYIDIHKHYNEI